MQEDAKHPFTSFLRLGSCGLPDRLASQVRAAQLSTAINYTPWMMLGNVVNASAVMFAFAGQSQEILAFAWGLMVIAMCLFTFLKWLRHRVKPRAKTASLRAVRSAVVNAAILGSLWGSLAPLLYPRADESAKLVLICVLAGMLCGSGFALSTIPAAAITFASAIAIGMVVALLLTPSIASALIFLMSVIYVAIIIRSSVSLSNLVTDRIVSDIRSQEQRDVIGLLLNDFTENASDWLWAMDRDMKVTQVSQRLCEFLNRPEPQFIGRHVSDCVPLLNARDCTTNDLEAIAALKMASHDVNPSRTCGFPSRSRVGSFCGPSPQSLSSARTARLTATGASAAT
jgi:PAS domain-containing protein